MKFTLIENETPYPIFLQINDNNFKLAASELGAVWKLLSSNYLVNKDVIPKASFKPLYAVKDDSAIYNNWLYDFDTLENLINYLILHGFKDNDIIRADFTNYDIFEIDVPETIYFTKDYINTVNMDWVNVDKIIADLHSSLIFYGFERKDN